MREAIPATARCAARDGEVVLIMGLPGAGKSTSPNPSWRAATPALNRDTAGGSLSDLLPEIDR